MIPVTPPPSPATQCRERESLSVEGEKSEHLTSPQIPEQPHPGTRSAPMAVGGFPMVQVPADPGPWLTPAVAGSRGPGALEAPVASTVPGSQ